MKTNWLALTLGMVLSFSLAAQQVIDVTTGTGTGLPGSTDPHWTVREPGGGSFSPAFITTGNSSSTAAAYATDNCGRWISSAVDVSGDPVNDDEGNYTYRLRFWVDGCVEDAILNLSFMAADNSITGVRVNGTAYTHPSGITFTQTGSMMGVPIQVVPGSNTLDVRVNNLDLITGMQVCGNITVPEIDLNMTCEANEHGNLLSWDVDPQATSYQVQVIWNNPACCEQLGDLRFESFNLTATSLLIPDPRDCFSWQLRPIYDGCETEFSDMMCSCGDACRTPSDLLCRDYFGGSLLSWEAVPGVQGYEVEVVWNSSKCCGSKSEPSTQTYTTTNNSLPVILSPFPGNCFSWRVRTICECSDPGRENEGDCASDWSDLRCSCAWTGPAGGGENKAGQSDSYTAVEDEEVRVAPIPASDVVVFNLNVKNTELTTGQLTIMDMNKRLVYSSVIDLREAVQVNVLDIPDGMYFYAIEFDAQVKTGKLLVQH